MTALKMVDLHRQYVSLKPQIDAALTSVLSTAAFIRGEDVAAFEHEMAAYLGVRHVVSCASGTDALQIAYMALGISAGDEVITTPFTFVATVEALVLLGARPVYVDIDPRTYNLDVGQLEACIAQNAGDRSRTPLRPDGRHGSRFGAGCAPSAARHRRHSAGHGGTVRRAPGRNAW